MFCVINFSSKNRSSLETILKIFTNIVQRENKLIQIFFFKKLQKKTTQQQITMLRSPHVHKRSSKKFKSNIYCKQVNLYCMNPKILFFLLKRLKEESFSDVNCKIKITLSKNRSLPIENLNSFDLKLVPKFNYLRFLDLNGQNLFSN